MRSAGAALADVAALGIASPGALDRARGLVVAASNLAGFRNVPLPGLLAERLGKPCVLENDANAAAYGEFVAGAGRDADSRTLVLLTLGTGVGGGIIHEGTLIRGQHDAGGEIGHAILVPDGRPCPCGQRGCVETYCSANATAARAVELLAADARSSSLRPVLAARGTLRSHEVAEQAAVGDAIAAQAWDETCRWIALTCLSLTHTVDPDTIVLAGGMSAAGEALLRPVQMHYAAAFWKMTPPTARLALARLGNDAGMIGAAAAAAASYGTGRA